VDELFGAVAEHVTARYGTFDLYVTTDSPARGVPAELIVLVRGDVAGQSKVLCRVASSCITSAALQSIECECSLQIDAALARIHTADCGVLIYLTDQEGRGQGLMTKVRALANKNQGFDTFAAVEQLGLEPDVRTYGAVGHILDALGIQSVVLLTGNPEKRDLIIDAGVKIEDTEPLEVSPHSRTRKSMRAKQAIGHTVVGQYVDDPTWPYP
jgi:3,4-dihydroxy 2-butanone 4-phosphate synthase/GTP cyclohydrolase II